MGTRGKTETVVRNNDRDRESQISFKHVNSEIVGQWLNEQDPNNFLGSAPDTIAVGGVEFKWFSDNHVNYPIEQYRNSYQATEAASNGEYPVIEVVVNRQSVKGAKGTYKWVFDKSTTGTGLK